MPAYGYTPFDLHHLDHIGNDHTMRSDYTGECDRCHSERPLWIDHDQPGEFAFCRPCWEKMAASVTTTDRAE